MKSIFYFLLLSLFLFSCGKEGPGGPASIQGLVKHGNTLIPGATVYIKYGAKESPGQNVTYYNANVTAHAKAHYQFLNLKRGDYYLFAIGFDSTVVQTVHGGIPAHIKSKTETVTADVPVSK